MSPLARFSMNLLIMLDEIGNTLTLGSPDETLSSRAAKGRARGSRFWTVFANALDWIQPGHCARSFEPNHGADAVLPD